MLDPTSNYDFTTIVSSNNFPDIQPGHECYAVPNPPSNTTSGSNATLQLSYLSTFDTEKNQTFYACADITYIPLTSLTEHPLCFNVSVADTNSTNTTTSASNSSAGSSSSGSGLSGGQIAGIVVGSVAGAALIAAALFLLWSRHQRRVQRDKFVAVRMSDWTKSQKTVSSDTNHA